ncbi:geminin [Polypterus senegalus]|uniref:geminin n=1 Tax=Polypterus senegalus TaxID=55291 RepID=UPI00196503EE|nr:geminin [Polypterus senegalus]XP_039594495.1 geminin [Polypterus senegalus]
MMNTDLRNRMDVHGSAGTVKSFTKGVGVPIPRKTLQMIQPSATTGNLVGRNEEVKPFPKRKLWAAENSRSSKRSKAEIPSVPSGTEDRVMTDEAYELMVKETPTAAYWKEVAEERRKALFKTLQENEKLHKEIESKNETILNLKQENEELLELAQHVQYMTSLIERLTGKSPENLEAVQDLVLEEPENVDTILTDAESVHEDACDENC